MDKVQVKKLLEQIISLYPNVKLTRDTAAIWAECLADISYDHARHNLIEHVKTSKFAPTIADIRGMRKNATAAVGNYCEVTGRAYELYVPPEQELN